MIAANKPNDFRVMIGLKNTEPNARAVVEEVNIIARNARLKAYDILL